MRNLATGAGGTLGSYICRELILAGHEVTGYSRNPPQSNEISWVRGDAEDCEALARAATGHDSIIHLAAIPGPGRATPEQLVAVDEFPRNATGKVQKADLRERAQRLPVGDR